MDAPFLLRNLEAACLPLFSAAANLHLSFWVLISPVQLQRDGRTGLPPLLLVSELSLQVFPLPHMQEVSLSLYCSIPGERQGYKDKTHKQSSKK